MPRSRRIVPLSKPIYRRVQNVVVRIAPEGLAIRGRGKRTWHEATWPQVLGLLADLRPAIDEAAGRELLLKITTPGKSKPKPKRAS